ncbi:MAG: FtsW/RodA/SpoVE family cell cycle protein [Rhodothalassiaceae bacterium]
MSLFARSDDSLIARWWWTVDRWLLVMIALLLGAGLLLNFAASPPVAERLALPPMHFVKRQGVFLIPCLFIMAGLSFLSPRGVRRLAIVSLPAALLALAATLLVGAEIKGASRWLQLGPFTLQPSEFVKPLFIVVAGWLLAAQMDDPRVPGRAVVAGLFALIAAMLALQPDFGQLVLITAILIAQLAIAGLPMVWLGLTGAAGLMGVAAAYATMPHVASRIDRFVNPNAGDTYQVDKAISAFQAGGLIGRGPGEGEIKRALPDAHTDYIFAVAGEEFGVIACLGLIAAFGVIVIRGLSFLAEEEDPFVMIAGSSLFMLFGTQALINLGVTLALMPAKGMTLPFISYGGSSLLALAVTMGMILALTRCNRFARGCR